MALLVGTWAMVAPTEISALNTGCSTYLWWEECSVDECHMSGYSGPIEYSVCVDNLQGECDAFCGDNWNYYGTVSGIEWDGNSCEGYCSCECNFDIDPTCEMMGWCSQ
jgi:hypothetical protein